MPPKKGRGRAQQEQQAAGTGRGRGRGGGGDVPQQQQMTQQQRVQGHPENKPPQQMQPQQQQMRPPMQQQQAPPTLQAFPPLGGSAWKPVPQPVIQQQQQQQQPSQPPPGFSNVLPTAKVASTGPIAPLASAAPPQPQAAPPTPGAGRGTGNVVDVTQSLAKFQLTPREAPAQQRAAVLPKRPAFSAKGRPIRLVANSYPVDIPNGSVYHYDVEIEHLKSLVAGEEVPKGEDTRKAKPQQVSGKRVPPAMTRIIIDKMSQAFPEFKPHLLAYDGNKNLYTRRPLPFKEPRHFTVVFREQGRDIDSRFKVSIKPVEKEGYKDSCEVSLEPLHAFFDGKTSTLPQEAITALDIILRSGPAKKMFPVRSSFFNIPRNPRDKSILTGGHEIWFGYYQSLRPGQWKPLLNIDKSATTFFPAGPVKDFFCSFLGKGENDIVRLADKEYTELNKEMKNVQIVVTHLPYRRKYRVIRVTRQSANEISFMEDKKDGTKQKKTIAEYFRATYKPLRNPQHPCLQVGNREKNICLPLEVCELVEGQHYRRKLTAVQTSEMIKFTAIDPVRRFQSIQQSLNSLSEMSRNYLKEYGINISPTPVHLDGRVLDAPNVLYNNKNVVQPVDGVWDMKRSRSRFFKGCNIAKWAIISFASPGYCTQDALGKFSSMLCSIGVEMGVTMAKCMAIKPADERRMGTERCLRQFVESCPGLELLVVVLGRFSNYAEIKTVADTKLGLMTQCIKDDSVVKKCNPQLIGNVLQKINAKMGGVNSSLNVGEKPLIFNRPVIIIGADVSHPSPGQHKPSVSACVGSLDSYPSRYACVVKVQKNRDEIQFRVETILGLKGMVRDLLVAFFKQTNVKPEKIIFFRDGVSEGQFADVQENEIPQIREACRSLQADYQPGITFVVVQKRHHTRFMPEDPRQGVGRAKNVPPGTLVDREVCSAADFDFFLCSHYGIQGTSRPAHYTVIWDDNNFTADELHKLTYHLCHTYVRCTRSISIPAPVQYAHLAAFRARHHIDTATGDTSSSDGENPFRESPELSQEVISAVDVTGKVSGSMYFV